MKPPQPFSLAATHTRWGRALLHFACILRGGNRRWHARGILRELLGLDVGAEPTATPSHSANGPTRRRTFRESLLPLVTAAHTLSCAVAAPTPTLLDLRPAAQVDSSGIFLQSVLTTTPSALDGRQIRLTDAPAFGRAVSFTPEQLTDLLRRAAPELPATAWSGAPQVRVTRRARSFGEAELRELLTATLQNDHVKDRGELELNFGRPWTALNLPDETLNLRVLNLPASGVNANFIVRFDLSVGAERFGPWQVIAQSRIMKELPVARYLLKRGQPLQGSDFTIERRDVLSLREPLDTAALTNPSLELIENVSAGQPLLARAVRMKPVVLRGQVVDGLVRDGSMNISLKVEVLADGLPGQTVRVRNPKTKREFHAKVQDEQTVLISL
jgi:flagellar basal body P-ring formation protein FlgA